MKLKEQLSKSAKDYAARLDRTEIPGYPAVYIAPASSAAVYDWQADTELADSGADRMGAICGLIASCVRDQSGASVFDDADDVAAMPPDFITEAGHRCLIAAGIVSEGEPTEAPEDEQEAAEEKPGPTGSGTS